MTDAHDHGDGHTDGVPMMPYLLTCLVGAMLGTVFYWLQSGSVLLLGWPGFTATGVGLMALAQRPSLLERREMIAAFAVGITAFGWGLGAVLPAFVPELQLMMPVTALVVAYAVLSAQTLGDNTRLVSLALILGVAPLLGALLLGDATEMMSALVLIAMTFGAYMTRGRDSRWDIQSAARMPVARPSAEPEAGADAKLKAELARLQRVETELSSAKSDAEAANMAKGEFLATMSHEMRTPLNGIIPLLDILRGTRLASDQQEYVNTAYQSANEMLRIIDDVLDYSKIEANKLELEMVGLNIREVVESVTRLMAKAAEKKGIRLEVVIEPQVRIIGRGDPVRLRQVLTNLVSNAIKFTGNGSVTVNISKRGDSRSHQQLLFAVKDTGVGIPASAQSRLFQPFSQADTSTTRHFGGTGLGLVICKRIIDLMQGSIGVRSEPGRGSVFWFEIPLLKALGDMAPARSDLSGARAMILSGDAQTQQRLKSWASKWNLQIESCNSPAEAANRLKAAATMGTSWAFELLIVDPGARRGVPVPFLRSLLRENSLSELHLLSLSASDEVPEDFRSEPRFQVSLRDAPEKDLKDAISKLLGIGDDAPPRFSLLQASSDPALQIGGSTAVEQGDDSPVRGHLLLVEDNVVNRQVAQRLLTLIGVSFEHAENGKEALAMLGKGQFHAVLMDCQMPVMDGYTATRARRQLEIESSLQRLPIIAMTANAMMGDREKCLACGMDDYLSKPLNRNLLEQTLRKWLPGDASNATPDSNVAPLKPASSASAGPPAPAAPVAARRAAESSTKPIKPAEPEFSVVDDHDALDMEIVNDLLEVMGAEFGDLIRIYLEDTPKNVALLVEAAKQGSVPAMIAPAHSLKSTSANLGALKLSELAKSIEHGARSGGLANGADLVRQLESAYRGAAKALNDLLNRLE